MKTRREDFTLKAIFGNFITPPLAILLSENIPGSIVKNVFFECETATRENTET